MKELVDQIVQQATDVILGKDHKIKLSLACLLARGHLLIEDIPGVGKTTLTLTLARCLGLDSSRVQFTSDLLPSDILGLTIYEKDSGNFTFHQGPVFSHIVHADEINRATPKCQSALLEAMEEHQVSIDKTTHSLPNPFFVIATQNPNHQLGTYPLPESQLDRFAMRINLGYPDPKAERALLAGKDRREIINNIKPCANADAIIALQNQVADIFVSDALLDYIQSLLLFTRQSADYPIGLSPRAGLALKHCSQAWAFIHGRDHVLPEDVQTVMPYVVGHRLQISSSTAENNSEQMAAQLACVPIP